MCRGMCVFFFFKQKTAYEMRISDWSSDVCSSDLTTFADGVVLTGTGKARDIKADATALSSGRLFDAESFWDARDEILQYSEIAVAGAGGAAGAISAWLCSALDERGGTTLPSIGPIRTLYPSGVEIGRAQCRVRVCQ